VSDRFVTTESNQTQNWDTESSNHAVAQAIKTLRDELADAIVRRIYGLEPELLTRFGEPGREKCLQDIKYNLLYLAEAINTATPSLFADYMAWLKTVLMEFEGLAEGLSRHLNLTCTVLLEQLPTTCFIFSAKPV